MVVAEAVVVAALVVGGWAALEAVMAVAVTVAAPEVVMVVADWEAVATAEVATEAAVRVMAAAVMAAAAMAVAVWEVVAMAAAARGAVSEAAIREGAGGAA
jgi:hypothetical protein